MRHTHRHTVAVGVAILLALLASACSNDNQQTNESTGEAESIGDCLLHYIPFATVAFDLAPDRSSVADSAESTEKAILTTSVDSLEPTALYHAVKTSDLAEIEFVTQTLADETRRTLSEQPEERTIVLARTNPVREFATVLIKHGEDGSYTAFDPCTGEWRDVTAEIQSAIAATGAETFDDAMKLVTTREGGHSDAFIRGWIAVEEERNSWINRDPDRRNFAQEDLPGDIAKTLVPGQIHLASTAQVDPASTYALCPRQSTALSGYCIPLAVLAESPDGLVLEIAIDPSEPVEIWLHDERLEPDGGIESILTITDLSDPIRIDVSGRVDQAATAKDAASELSFIQHLTTSDILRWAEDEGVPIVGGFEAPSAANSEPESDPPEGFDIVEEEEIENP